jgi:hypothetical protein
MLSNALKTSGRAMLLSLSPGPAPIGALPELRRYADLWRISNDAWDIWNSSGDYPKGLADMFPLAALWAPEARPGGLAGRRYAHDRLPGTRPRLGRRPQQPIDRGRATHLDLSLVHIRFVPDDRREPDAHGQPLPDGKVCCGSRWPLTRHICIARRSDNTYSASGPAARRLINWRQKLLY